MTDYWFIMNELDAEEERKELKRMRSNSRDEEDKKEKVKKRGMHF